MKSKTTAYLLWCLFFVGICGIHRFYTRNYITGIIQLLTFGGFGIWQIIDLFYIPDLVNSANANFSGHFNQNISQNVHIHINRGDIDKS